jgi:DNA polymerase III subunit gamma/tau
MAKEQYLVLARKWRPQTFDDVVGQAHITRTLQNSLRSGRIHHAFLFIGSRGIGKTTSARILAKALNCTAQDGPTPEPCGVCPNCESIAIGNNVNVIEIDGASNNSVEDVRQIRENVRMVPAGGRYKIYVIDEVHQLSIAAFNALLKTLEEPPPHAIFILATTEAHKVPATIISRCQRYDYRRVSVADLMTLLRKILDAEGMVCSDEALAAIARAADGGVRDSESILDQLMSYCDKEITFKDVFDVLGLVDWEVMHTLCAAIREKDVVPLLKTVDDIVVSGKDLSQFVQDILRYFRNLMICKSNGPTELLALPEEEVAEMRARAQQFTLMELIRLVEQFSELVDGFDSQLAQRTALEAMLIKVTKRSVDVSVDSILEKLVLLQEQLTNGSLDDTQKKKILNSATPQSTPKKTEPIKKVQPVATPEPTTIETPQPTEKIAPVTAPPPVQQSPPTPVSTRKRLTLSPKTFGEDWPQILEVATHDHMNLATWLPHARPYTVEGDTVILHLADDQDLAKSIIEKNPNREIIEDALKQVTDNVTTFRVELKAGLPTQAAVQVQEQTVAAHGLPISERISLTDDKKALDDPNVSQLVEVFRGTIVDIQHKIKP